MAKPRRFFTDFDVFYDFVCDNMHSHGGAIGETNAGGMSAGIGAGIGALLGGPIGAALGAGVGGAGAWMLAKAWIQDDDEEVVQRRRLKRKFMALLRKRENGDLSPRKHRKAVNALAQDLEDEMF